MLQFIVTVKWLIARYIDEVKVNGGDLHRNSTCVSSVVLYWARPVKDKRCLYVIYMWCEEKGQTDT